MLQEDQFDDEIDIAVDNAEGNNITVNEYRSSITVGDVETLPSGSPAYVTNAGTEKDVILNFGLPKGNSGTTWGGIDGTISNQADLQAIITSLTSRITALEETLPVTGTIMSVLKSSIPGWILCDGRAISRATYANLFSVIGVSFGHGDGSSTFNVPDYRGCFLRGLGGASAPTFAQRQPMGAPNITARAADNVNDKDIGWINGVVEGGFYYGKRKYSGNVKYNGISTSDMNALCSDASRVSTVYGTANEIRPTNHAVNFFIKY